MTLHQRPPSEALPAASPISPERGQWNWLAVARIAWIVLAILLLAYFVAGIPVAYQLLGTVCTPSNPVQCTISLTPGNVQALARLPLSVAAYVDFQVALLVALSLLFWVVGVLIFWRKSQEWRGLFFSLVLLLFGAGGELADGIGGISVTAQTPLFLQLLVYVSRVITDVQWPALAAFVLTFPTGRFTPRWSWLLIVPEVVADFPVSPNPVLYAVGSIAILLTFGGMVGVQIYRYVRVYDAVQRQQTKWFIFASGVAIFLNVIYSGLGAVVPSLGAPDSWYQLLNALTTLVILAVFPLSVGIAILRYRLWDIDALINRTLVYSSLTVLLVGLYVGLILALQALVGAVIGSLSQQQPLVIVASTLVIAALFQPLRRRLQAIIDRRFYRRKYDAAKIVAAFSATLRQEVDLDTLREQLVAVVQETMQPAHVSLWLRPPEPARKHQMPWSSSPLSPEAGEQG
jgi:hypothetical protein